MSSPFEGSSNNSVVAFIIASFLSHPFVEHLCLAYDLRQIVIMPRLKPKRRPSTGSSIGRVEAKQSCSSKATNRKKVKAAAAKGGDSRSKGKPREYGMEQPVAAWPQIYARGDEFQSTPIPVFIPATFTSSPASTASPSPTIMAQTASSTTPLHHNVPLMLCIVTGAVIAAATISVGLAWILRLACCANERRARRERKAARSPWNSSSAASESGDKADARSSLDSVTVKGADTDLEQKDAKMDALFDETINQDRLVSNMPVLSYSGGNAPKSTWNGKGWTLFDPPVAAVQLPQTAAVGSGGGNYGAARGELADRDVEGFTWPSSIQRQPSFIERLVQRHHPATDLPTTAPPLPYPFQAKAVQSASRMASLGGAANRAVMNMLPVTLRNAATSASRQRATRKRYHDMQPYLDSDFEGTIGAKDRELPMARRLWKAEERFAVDWTTEEEGSSSPQHVKSQSDDHLRNPRVQPVLIPTPMLDAKGNAQAECTPGLAGVGAAWSRKGSQSSSLVGPPVPMAARSSTAVAQMSKVIEPNRVSMLPFPAMEGDRRTRLLGSVGRWLGQVPDSTEVADPYTAPSPRPGRRLTKTGSLRSDYTSTTLADSGASSSDTLGDASSKTERLLQRVDADQAEHDRQQRRLLRKVRMFARNADTNKQQVDQQKDAEVDDAAVSRAPSIRPQFCATTDLKSWLEPNKVSTTHGFKVLEEQDVLSKGAVDPFASDVETNKRPKMRSSSTKSQLRASTVGSARAGGKGASRQKREALGSVNSRLVKKGSYGALASAAQSSADITVVSSVFDEAFAAQLRKPASDNSLKTKAEAKAEADAAVKDALRRRRMLSISSRGSQQSRASRAPCQAGALLSREESMRSQPSVYSELTAASDYQFKAPLFSDWTCGGASTIDPMSEEHDERQEENKQTTKQAQEEKKREEQVLLKKQVEKEAKRQAKRAERKHVKDFTAAEKDSQALPRVIVPSALPIRGQLEAAAQQPSVRRTIKPQRSISLGAVRSQFVAADAEVNLPDSPWTSSDSDISMRRWGEPRRDDSHCFQKQGSRVVTDAVSANVRSRSRHGRAHSHYYGMGAGDLRDFC